MEILRRETQRSDGERRVDEIPLFPASDVRSASDRRGPSFDVFDDEKFFQRVQVIEKRPIGNGICRSDVDILCDKGDITTLIEQGKLEEELEEQLGKKVDLVFATSSMDDYFKEQMQKDLIELC